MSEMKNMTNRATGMSQIGFEAPNKFKIIQLGVANTVQNFDLKTPGYEKAQMISITATGSYYIRISQDDGTDLAPLYEATLTPGSIDEGAEINQGFYEISPGQDRWVSVAGIDDNVILTMAFYR